MANQSLAAMEEVNRRIVEEEAANPVFAQQEQLADQHPHLSSPPAES